MTTTTSTAAAAAAAAEVENSAATESRLAQPGELELAIVVYDPRKKPGNEYAEFEAFPKDGHSNAQCSSSAAEPRAPKSGTTSVVNELLHLQCTQRFVNLLLN